MVLGGSAALEVLMDGDQPGVMDDGAIRQVLTGEMLADLVDIPGATVGDAPSGYTIFLYPYSQRGIKSALTGLYQPVAGTEIKTVRIEKKTNAMTGSPNGVMITKWLKEGNHTRTYQFDYEQVLGSWTQWTLTDSAGRKEILLQTELGNIGGHPRYSEDKQVFDTQQATPKLISKEFRIFQRLPGAEVPLRVTRGVTGAEETWQWKYYTTRYGQGLTEQYKPIYQIQPNGAWIYYPEGEQTHSHSGAGDTSFLHDEIDDSITFQPAPGEPVARTLEATKFPDSGVEERYGGNVLSKRAASINWGWVESEKAATQKLETIKSYLFPNPPSDDLGHPHHFAFQQSVSLSEGLHKAISVNSAGGGTTIEYIVNPKAFEPIRSVDAQGVVTISSSTEEPFAVGGTGNETVRVFTADRGVVGVDPNVVVDGTRRVEKRSLAGHVYEEVEYVISAGVVSATPTSRRTATAFGELGRPKSWVFEDGTTETTELDCCGVVERVDRHGVKTEFQRDDFGFINYEKRDGITMHYTNDALGRRVRTEREGTDGTRLLVEEVEYDLAGRVKKRMDALGRETLFGFGETVAGGQIKTTTYPGGGTRVETYYRDGQLKSVTGTAVSPMRYEYGVEDQNYTTAEGVSGTIHSRFTKEIRLDAAGADEGWTKTYLDMVGQVFRTESSLPSGAVAVTLNTYNAKGQLVKTVDADGVITLFAYNAKGEREVECVDRNQDGVIDYVGTDFISKTTQENAMHGTYPVERTRQWQWQANGNGTPTLISEVDRTLDGKREWRTQYGQASSRVVVEPAVRDGSETETVTFPDGTYTVEERYLGRTLSRKRYGATGGLLEKEDFDYSDRFHRLKSQTSENSKTTDFVYYNDDQIATVTGPDPDGALGPLGRPETNYLGS